MIFSSDLVSSENICLTKHSITKMLVKSVCSNMTFRAWCKTWEINDDVCLKSQNPSACLRISICNEEKKKIVIKTAIIITLEKFGTKLRAWWFQSAIFLEMTSFSFLKTWPAAPKIDENKLFLNLCSIL